MVAAITDAQSRADQFLNQLALPTAQAVQLINTSQGSAYEVYVLTLVLIGLQEGGWTVELRQLANPTSPGGPEMFCVRGSPGAMLPQLSFARCISPSGRAYHLMLNIQFRGGSEARHEADVSIVAEGDSPVGRMLAALSSASTLLGVIECKNYTKYVSIGQLRQFIGGIIDMEQGKGRRRLPGVKLRQNCLFVSTKRMSMDAGYYARAFNVALEGELRPPPPTQVFVVSDREREFIGVARNWITRAAV